MKKILTVTFTLFALTTTLPALAKDPKIDSNTSGISDTVLISSAALSAIGSGAKEPLNISGNSNQLIIEGSNGISCNIPVTNGKINGVNCK